MTGRRIDIAGRTAGVLAGGLRPPARTYAHCRPHGRSRGLLALAALSMARSMVRDGFGAGLGDGDRLGYTKDKERFGGKSRMGGPVGASWSARGLIAAGGQGGPMRAVARLRADANGSHAVRDGARHGGSAATHAAPPRLMSHD